MIKHKCDSLIIGGTGQFGITLKNQLIKKKKKVVITTRYKKSNIRESKFRIVKLDVQNKRKIFKVIKDNKPKNIFYFDSQSSPSISFIKKKATFQANFNGCKNVLETIYKYNKDIKFFYAASSEMYGRLKGKISLKSKKKPVNPYGESKLKGFNITKTYREKYKLKTYNLIFFNTESTLRDTSFFIPKVCIAAINAKKNKTKTAFGNLNIKREWNWCEDQCEILIKLMKKEPQDFIISNGKCLSAKKMIHFAFNYFKLDYRKFVYTDKKFLRPEDIQIKKSKFSEVLKKYKKKKKNFIFGKKLIYLMIRHYIKNS